MPELGKATYYLEVDADEFRRELAAAKVEAAAAARSINDSLSDIHVGARPHVAAVTQIQAAHRGLFQEASAGYSDLAAAMGVAGAAARKHDLAAGLGNSIAATHLLNSQFGTTNDLVQLMEKRVESLTSKITRAHQLGLSTTKAESDLAQMSRMLDRFYRDTTNRAIQMDRDLSRRFGLQSGGTRGGLLSRLLGVAYAVPRGGATGVSSDEAALMAGLTSAVEGGMQASGTGTPGGPGVGGTRRNDGSNRSSGLLPGLANFLNRNKGLIYKRSKMPILGAMGAAGFGSLASMVGLGPEHALGALLAMGGTVAGAGLGLGTIAMGAAGQFAVGAGSDLAVNKTTLTNVQTLYKAYSNLQTAVQTYGAKSVAAHNAQLQFNATMSALSDSVGPKTANAMLGLTKQVSGLSDDWQQVTSSAQLASTKLFSDVVTLADKFVQPIADAAQRNITIIRGALQPLFQWLEGPQGMGIFRDLENHFAAHLPTAIHAFSQAVELLLKMMDTASQYTGGFTRKLDELFTKWNSPAGFPSVKRHMAHWIADWRLVSDIVKTFVKDIFVLFHDSSGEGTTLLGLLDKLMHKVHSWETTHQSFLKTFFAQRQQELLGLINLASAVANPALKLFGSLYIAVQPLVPVITAVANGLAHVVTALTQLGKHSTVFQDTVLMPLGATLLAGRLFGFGKVGGAAKGLGGLLGLGGAGTAAAEGATGAVAAGGLAKGLSKLLGKVGIGAGAEGIQGALKAGMRGLGIAMVGSVAAQLVGSIVGGAGGHLISGIGTGAATGAAIGSVIPGVGTAIGAVGGGLIGGLLSLTGPSDKLKSLERQAATMAKKGDIAGLVKLRKQAVQLAGTLDTQGGPALGRFGTGMHQTRDAVDQAAAAFANRLQVAISNLRDDMAGPMMQALDQINGQYGFPAVQKIISDTSLTVQQKSADVVAALTSIATNGTGPMAKNARAALNQLRQDTQTDLNAMQQATTQSIGAMKVQIEDGSQQAAKSADTNMRAFMQSVENAMAAGTYATSKGMQMIAQTTDQVIKALGGRQIPIPQLIHAQQLQSLYSQGKTGVAGVLTGNYSGGYITEPSYIVGEEAPQHPEYVLATNPAYRQRNVGLWMSAGHDLGIPGFAYGGYIDPISGFTLGRTDMGVDANAAPGTPIRALGPSRMVGYQSNWYAGQPEMVFQLLGGPDTGRFWYVAEQIIPLAHQGQNIPQGGIVARYAPFGTGIEIGWAANASGLTLAQATGNTGGPGHANAPAGQSFRAFLAGAAPGPVGGAVPTIAAPRVKGGGVIAQIVQAAFNDATSAANQFIGAAGGAAGYTGRLSGSVEQQVYQYFRAHGFNKMAVAGLLGNAMQESSMNPNAPGGGLWQQISNFGGGTGGSLLHQMAAMLPQIIGLRGGLNAAASPAAAAALFMSSFERPAAWAANLAARIGYANEAYASGFARGGKPRRHRHRPVHHKRPARFHHVPPVFHHGSLGAGPGSGGSMPWSASLSPLTSAFSIIPDAANFLANIQNGYDPWVQGLQGAYSTASSLASVTYPDGSTHVTFTGDDAALLNSVMPPGLLNIAGSPHISAVLGGGWPQASTGENVYDYLAAVDYSELNLWSNKQAAESAALAMILGDTRHMQSFSGVNQLGSVSAGRGGALWARLKRLASINQIMQADLRRAKGIQALQQKIQARLRALRTGSLKQQLSREGSRQALQAQMYGTQSQIYASAQAVSRYQQALANEQSLGQYADYGYMQALRGRIFAETETIQGLRAVQMQQQRAANMASGRQAVSSIRRSLIANALENENASLSLTLQKLGSQMSNLGGVSINAPLGGVATGGVAGQIISQVGNLQSASSSLLGDLQGIPPTVAGIKIDLMNLAHEKQQAGLGGTAAAQQQQSDLIALQQQQLDSQARTIAVLELQTPVLKGFAGAAKTFLGAFATGTPYVPSTGMALVHKGEAIIPASMNPYTGGGRPEVHIHGGLGALVDSIELVVDGKKQAISDFVNHDLAESARARRLLPGGSPVRMGARGGR